VENVAKLLTNKIYIRDSVPV